MQKNYDIIIIGSGIVGLVLANQLAQTALQIAIIDKQLPTANTTSDIHLRVSAITPASQQILTSLDIWQQLPPATLSPFTKMHIWTPAGNHLDFNCAEIHAPALGYIAENHLLQMALYQRLSHFKNVHFMTALLTEINCTDNQVEINLERQKLTTSLLIGADGAQSQVRQLSNIAINEYDYQHTSIIATVKTAQPHQQTAWQHFLPTGPLAFLPLPDPHTCSIVWSTAPAEAEHLLQQTDAEFNQALTHAFANKLGAVQTISKRISFPLRHRHAKHYIKPNIALIGDAAHTIHPLAGQGLNLGLLDADCLAKILFMALEKNRPIGNFADLRKYERARKADNTLMFNVVDKLKKLFSASFAPVKLMRDSGLNIINNNEWLKQFLLKQATGFRE